MFTSTGEKGSNWDIWLKIVGEAEARRLTTDPEGDVGPEWSPDGKQIAFLRFRSQSAGGRIYLISPVGGSERPLVDFPADWSLSWSPDGRWLAVSRLRAHGETTPASRFRSRASTAGPSTT